MTIECFQRVENTDEYSEFLEECSRKGTCVPDDLSEEANRKIERETFNGAEMKMHPGINGLYKQFPIGYSKWFWVKDIPSEIEIIRVPFYW